MLDQPVEAWRYGPVIPDIYHSRRRYGGEPIRRPIHLESVDVTERPYDREQINIINQVSEKYGHVSGIRLSSMTHAPGTPWHQVWKQRQRPAIIPAPVIEDYYAAQLERHNTKTNQRKGE